MKKFFTLSLMAMVAVLAMAQSFPEKVYLVGPATSVGWEIGKLAMYNNGDGTYEYVGMLYNGEYGNAFKMLGAADWLPSYGPVTNGTAIAAGANYDLEVRTSYEMGDNQFAVQTEGRYHLTLNLAENKLYVAAATEGEADKNGNEQVFHFYMVGSGCSTGWSLDDAVEIENKGEGVFEGNATLTASGEMKFLCQRDWGLHYGPEVNGEALNGAGTYSLARHEDGDYKYAVSLSGTYHFVLNLTAGTMVVSNPTALKNVNDNANVNKVIENGHMVILKNGVRYNAQGARF